MRPPLRPAFALALAPLASAAQDAPTRLLHAQIPPLPGPTTALEAADVDGDGDLDGIHATPLRVLVNDGRGLLAAGPVQAPAAPGDLRAELADLDGDGDLDLVLGGAPARLLWNDGAGTFALDPAFPASGGSEAPGLGDLDGDGDRDALLAGHGAAQVLLNDGAGAFAAGPPPATPPGAAELVRLADLDGDGDLDAFVGSAGAAPLDTLYRNAGGGILVDASASLPSTATATHGARFGDVDLDGDLDLVRKYAYDPLLSYLNDGAGVFVKGPVATELLSPSAGDVALGDVDSDGVLDAAVSAAGKAVVSLPARTTLLLGDGAGGWIDATGALPELVHAQTTHVLLADLDGDGDLDLATGAEVDPPRLALGDGAGAFRDVASFLPPTDAPAASVAVGDVDQDGFPDALVGTRAGYASRLLRGGAEGAWVDGSDALPPHEREVARTLLGDLDQDGDLDGVWVEAEAAGAAWVLESRNGRFALHLAAPTASARDAELGDLDQDGDLDLAVAGLAESLTAQNDGAAAFAVQDVFASLPLVALGLGDLDGDGVLDAWGGPAEGAQRAWRGDGAGGLDLWKTVGPVTATADVALGDFDADGDLDAAVLGTPAMLYRNDGGAFAPAPLPAGPGGIAGRAVAADLDGDGALDLVGADAWLANDGSGAFVAEPLHAEPHVGGLALAVHDLDLDGDLDVYAAGYQDQPLWNVARQLARRHLPALGKPLALDLFGPAGAPYALAWSPAAAALPLPPLGLLRLDPAALHPLAVGALAPGGAAAFETALPADPALAGTTVFAQALLGVPPGFTNLEWVTLDVY